MAGMSLCRLCKSRPACLGGMGGTFGAWFRGTVVLVILAGVAWTGCMDGAWEISSRAVLGGLTLTGEGYYL